MKKCILAVIVSLIFISIFSCVYAESSMLVQYSAENGKIEIKGNFDGIESVIAGLMILPESVNRESLTADDITTNKYIMDTVRINKNGVFSKSVVMPDSAQTGKYNIYLNYGANCLDSKVLYTNISQADTVVKELYNKSGQEYLSYYEANIEKLGIESEKFKLYKNTMSEIMQAKKINITTDFIIEQNRVLALCRIMNSITDETVLKYENYFDIDYEKEFKDLSLNIKNSFVQYVKAEDKLKKDSKDVFWDSYIMANIKNAENYPKLQKMILGFNDKIKLNLTDYNKLTEYYKSKVFSEMFEKGIEKYEQIPELFNTAVKNAKNSAEKGEGSKVPSGGGGGGGGAGGNKTTGTTTSEISIGKPLKDKETFLLDVSGHWAEQSILALYEKGVINGFEDKTYRPENKITRAEFIKIMTEILDLPSFGDAGFIDVKKSDWYFAAVCAAKSYGLVMGNDGKFNPDENITRQDTAVIIFRALELKGIALNEETNFSDENLVLDYAKEAVLKLGGANIIQGFDGMFNPLNNTTRAEVAVLAERIIKIFEG